MYRHGSGHLRELLLDWLDGTFLGAYPGYLSDVVGEDEQPIRSVIGRLWNCTDTLPGDYCVDVGVPRSSTYAQAVRFLSRTLR